MRQWKIDPALMCRAHLLGEHCELHMYVGHIKAGRSMRGFVRGGLVEVDQLVARHDALVAEMQKRGYAHRSPLEFDPAAFDWPDGFGHIVAWQSRELLSKRCAECKARIEGEDDESRL